MNSAILQRLIRTQRRASAWFDSFLPEALRVDGNESFLKVVLPQYLPRNALVYDVGGGRTPYISTAEKKRLGLIVVGVDIDSAELSAAPEGSYDRTIVGDVSSLEGAQDGALVICQSLLEHVPDAALALRGIASCVGPGGVVALFAPSRRAWFARLNVLLPERLKRKLLFTVFPSTEGRQGFPAYYNRCTPRELSALAATVGLQVVEQRAYFVSSYFSFFFPLYVLWRLALLIRIGLFGNEAAETFILILRRERY